jgi:hypothetical protein
MFTKIFFLRVDPLFITPIEQPKHSMVFFWDYPKEVKFALVLKELVIHSCPN